MADHRARRAIVKIAFCVFSLSMIGSTMSRAIERPRDGTWLVGVDLQQRSFDTMSAGDERPVARGEAGAQLSVDRLLTRAWSVGIAGRFGGTWMDWSESIYNISGKVEDATWSARVGLDRVLPIGARGIALLGAGIEYGEAHSWVNSVGPTADISDEGPRCYMTGGFARVALLSPTWRRIGLSAEVSESFYGAHAVEPQNETHYDWLGRALALSVGVRYRIGR